LEILHYPDPVLRKKGAAVEEITADVTARAQEMLEAMYEARGVGLAAPQVGWSAQLCVINPTPDDRANERVCVNPTIVEASGEEVAEEGCLSLPEVQGHVKRFTHVTCVWYDLEGRRHEVAAEGLLARIFQHEVDHLNGRLIIDRMTPASRLSVRSRLKELEREHKARPRRAVRSLGRSARAAE
jgi:peptide deformylase